MSSNDNHNQNNSWANNRDAMPEWVKKGMCLLVRKAPSPNGSGVGYSFNILGLIGLVVGVVVLLWILSGIFIIAPAEQGVVLRLGHYYATVNPGPHWIPPFIDKKYVVNVQQINNFPYQSEMLTKDENIVSVAVAVQYRVDNPRNYLFNVIGPVNTLQQATSSALRQVVGQMTLNDVLTTGRETLRDQVRAQLIRTLSLYHTGLEVMDVALQATKPPKAVSAAFDDAVKAREDSQRYINKAQAYARRVLLTAQGQIARMEQEAIAYKSAVVLAAYGNVARYKALLKPYQQAKQVTQERLYLDVVSDVLSHTTNIILDGNNSNILYLPVDQLLKQHSIHASPTDKVNGATGGSNE